MFLRAVALSLALIGNAACARDGADLRAHETVAMADCEVRGYPAAAQCGTYEVWENRAARAGRRIALNFVVLPALQRPVRPDPLFYFDGGPGAGAAGAAGNIGRLLRAVNQTRDLVFVDVRGTGRSNPLECVEPGASEPLQAHFDDFLSDAYVRRCLEHQRADVRFYTQPFAMDDINELRAALGYEKINVFGASGGTRQEQIYMKRHPASVRSVVMHGVQAMDGEMPLPFSRALEAGVAGLLDACATDEWCRGAYPDLRADWERVKKRFDDGPVEATVTHPRDGRSERVRISRGVYADGLRHQLYDWNTARAIPDEIHRAAQGDFGPFAARALAQSIRYADVLSYGMFMSATCAEDVRFIDDDELQRATAGTFLGDYRVKRQQAACRIWPPGEGIDAGFQEPVTLDVPVLVLSGALDVATPPSEAERVARQLPRSRHVVFPHQGHTFANPECIATLIAGFLESPDPASLDESCAATTQPLRFRR